MTNCDHSWQYVYAVYSTARDRTAVRRRCSKCGMSRVGVVGYWRPERKNEFDQTCERALKELNG